MSNRRMLLAALLLVVCGGLMWLLLASAPREAVYRGKPLSYWLTGYDFRRYNAAHSNELPAPTYPQANDAIRHMGASAIPTLIEMLKERDSPLKKELISLAQKQHLFHVPFSSPANETLKAMTAFQAMGPQTVDVAPQLVEVYDTDPSGFSRQVVPTILMYVAPTAPETTALLLRALVDTNDAIVRGNAANAIAQIHPKPEIFVPVLTKALSDPDLWVQASTARALGTFGAGAKSAVPMLVQQLQRERAIDAGAASAAPVTQSGFQPSSLHSTSFVFAPAASRGRVAFPIPRRDAIAAMEDALKAIDPGAAEAALK
jgi:HEAT repeat protein